MNIQLINSHDDTVLRHFSIVPDAGKNASFQSKTAA